MGHTVGVGVCIGVEVEVVVDAVGIDDAGGVVVAGDVDEGLFYCFNLLFKLNVVLCRFFFADIVRPNLDVNTTPL